MLDWMADTIFLASWNVLSSDHLGLTRFSSSAISLWQITKAAWAEMRLAVTNDGIDIKKTLVLLWFNPKNRGKLPKQNYS